MRAELQTIAGLHVSGPNINRTALTILEGSQLKGNLKIRKTYEKIAQMGRVFSDDLLLEILDHEGPIDLVVLDAPLTLPPCIECVRPECPGTDHCTDTEVAYMTAIHAKGKKKNSPRTVNPQTKRAFDLMVQRQFTNFFPEPTFSANKAAIATRARVLCKRLRQLSNKPEVCEVNTLAAVQGLWSNWDNIDTIAHRLRSMDSAKEARRTLLETQRLTFIQNIHGYHEQLASSRELFSAIISATMGALHLGEGTLPEFHQLQKHKFLLPIPIPTNTQL